MKSEKLALTGEGDLSEGEDVGGDHGLDLAEGVREDRQRVQQHHTQLKYTVCPRSLAYIYIFSKLSKLAKSSLTLCTRDKPKAKPSVELQ